MIVVKIELWSARTGEHSELGRMYIANTGDSKDPKRGDYTAFVCRKGSTHVPKPLNPNGLEPSRTAAVKNYPRLSYNVWRLVMRCLRGAFPEEHGS